MYYAKPKLLDRDMYPFLLSSPPYSPKPSVLQHSMVKIPDTVWFNLWAIFLHQFVMKHVQGLKHNQETILQEKIQLVAGYAL